MTGIAEMKRHYSSYFKAIPNFKEYRTKMVTANSEDEVLEILDKVLLNFSNYLMDWSIKRDVNHDAI